MAIIDNFFHIFDECQHPNKTFLGIQETNDPNVFLLLYNCDDCHSTITESSKNNNDRRLP